MTADLARALRRAAAGALPDGAFLRRDRGDGLFVTDAPRLAPGGDWPDRLAAAGFCCRVNGGLARLRPGAGWLRRLEEDRPEPPDDLCAGLLRFRGLAAEEESLALFALGARALDAGGDPAPYDRLLRRRAAACLRLNRMNPLDPLRGGGLYACALLRHEFEGGKLT